MAKKRLDVAAITNELQHSAFFPGVQPATPSAHHAPAAAAVAEASSPLSPASVPLSPAMAMSSSSVSSSYAAAVAGHASKPTSAAEPTPTPRPHPSPTLQPPAKKTTDTPDDEGNDRQIASKRASANASMLARHQEGNHQAKQVDQVDQDSPTSREPSRAVEVTDGHEQRVIEAIRKCVKQVGKEVSFVRLTPEEKRQLAEITYTYKSQGIKTSENEISRVGINWMLEDYHANGANSVLAQVLAALSA